MTVESVTYIDSLDHNRPQGGDSIAQGDDHIRNIKKAIKQTFPKVEGEVLASHEEINLLVGVTEPIVDIGKDLDDHIQAIDDQINQQDGLKDQIEANKQAIEDNAQALVDQKLGDHADVDLTGLEVGMVVVWDGTKWVPQEMTSGGGGMIKVVQQPDRAGDFSYQGPEQVYTCPAPAGATTTRTLTVPDGKVFCFEYLFAIHGSGTGKSVIPVDGIVVDGVQVAPASSGNLNYYDNGGPTWPGNDKSSIIRVEESLAIKINPQADSGTIWVAGIFAEA